MDASVDGVTLMSVYVFDVLSAYRAFEKSCPRLFEMAGGLDPSRPDAPCSLALYNDICRWIERHLGGTSIVEAGRVVGRRVFSEMDRTGLLSADPDPHQLLEALCRAEGLVLHDPRHRGFTILESHPERVVIRRTQTFNCMLQEGLLVSLIEQAHVLVPAARHLRCTRDGAEYCDYEITWSPSRRRR
jgi:hypothetical protein